MNSIYFDPREKKEQEESLEEQQNEEGVILVNDDGTEFDSSEQTYVSVDLPEEDNESGSKREGEKNE